MGTDVNELAEPLRTSVVGLLAEANANGTRVIVSSARRTLDEQVALRRKNCGQTDYAIWQMPSGDCKPETAIPGRSKHETGQAVDFGGDLALVAKLAPKYELVQTVAKERWHYEHASTAGGTAQPDGTNQGFLGGGVSSASPVDVADAAAGEYVPGYSAIKDTAGAAVAVARAFLNPDTWLRVIAVVGGGALALVGFSLIAQDLTGVSAVGLARTASNPARAVRNTTPAQAGGAVNPATPPA